MSSQLSTIGPAAPISIHIPSALRPFTVPVRSFLVRNSNYDRLVCSAFIFAPHSCHHKSHSDDSVAPSRLLLLRRSATDIAFPNLWEVPGGTIDEVDPTILHGLAREIFEEAGLRLTRFVRLVGQGIEWTTTDEHGGNPKQCSWLKLGFEVEVDEIKKSTTSIEEKDVEGYLDSLPVHLDPEEHQEHAWVTEKEVRAFYEEGVGREIVSKEQAGKMLHAFYLRKIAMGPWQG
ncbi:MAG: hypothetical protein Q9166_001040 [cf. Caloplaca sp. 2 TL-2023]